MKVTQEGGIRTTRGDKEDLDKMRKMEEEDPWDEIDLDAKDQQEVQAFLELSDRYTSPSSTKVERAQVLEEGLKDFSIFMLATAPRVDTHESSIARKANFLSFLDDLRIERFRRGDSEISEDWDSILTEYYQHSESALLSYKAEAMLTRETFESLQQVSSDHAKEALLSYAKYVNDGGSLWLDPRMKKIWNGKTYEQLSELLSDVGEERLWEVVSDEEAVAMWAHFIDEHGTELTLREELATADLKRRYPDKRTDLQQSVSETDIVTDLAQGAIGVFDAYGRLQTISTDGGNTLHPLQEERLFSADASVSQEERQRKEQAVLDVASVMDLRVRELIQRDYGLNLAQLSLREQVWFSANLRFITPKAEERLIHFVKDYGVDGARALLSAEFGDEFREYVLAIGKRFDKKTAKKIFHAFGEIATFAQTEAGKLIEAFFVKGKGQPVDSAKVEMELLKRAKSLIEEFAREAMKAKATGEKPDSDHLLKQLEQASADTALFASIFKAAFKGEKGVDFEAIRGVELKTQKAGDISKEEQKGMEEIAKKNWKQSKLSIYVPKTIKQKLSPQNTKTDWSLLERDGSILGYLRFDHTDDPGHLYLGSINVDQKQRGSGIGEALIREIVEERSKDHTMDLHAEPDSTVSTSYTETFGFVITGLETVQTEVLQKDGTTKIENVPLLHMYRSNEDNVQYKGRGKEITVEQITKAAEEGTKLPHGLEVMVVEDEDALLDVVRDVTSKTSGKVVTRYLYDHKTPARRYLVIESRLTKEVPEVSQTEEVMIAA